MKRTCQQPGCRGLVEGGTCSVCGPRKQEQYRGNSAERGYDRRWRNARIEFLSQHPLCIVCEATGKIEAATVIDHIRPHRGDPVLFWDRQNWQPLCDAHHAEKTARGE